MVKGGDGKGEGKRGREGMVRGEGVVKGGGKRKKDKDESHIVPK